MLYRKRPTLAAFVWLSGITTFTQKLHACTQRKSKRWIVCRRFLARWNHHRHVRLSPVRVTDGRSMASAYLPQPSIAGFTMSPTHFVHFANFKQDRSCKVLTFRLTNPAYWVSTARVVVGVAKSVAYLAKRDAAGELTEYQAHKIAPCIKKLWHVCPCHAIFTNYLINSLGNSWITWAKSVIFAMEDGLVLRKR